MVGASGPAPGAFQAGALDDGAASFLPHRGPALWPTRGGGSSRLAGGAPQTMVSEKIISPSVSKNV
jgi:hypothetical protein